MAPPEKKQKVSVETPLVAPETVNAGDTETVTSGDNNNESQLDNETSVAAMVKIVTERMFDDDVKEVEKTFKELDGMVLGNEESSKLLMKLGGPSFVLGLMGKWNKSRRIQGYGCGILGDCCQFGNEEERKTIFQLGAVDVALKSMKELPDDRFVQNNAINLLGELARNEDCAKFMILDCDALELVISSMTKFPTVEELQHHVCEFLMRTSTVKELRKPMMKAGALAALCQMIVTFVEGTSDKQTYIHLFARSAMNQLTEK